MAPLKTIIFGATGRVGSATALIAQQQGAKVYLALRDTSKSVPNITSEQEKQDGLERVEADLTNPDTVRDAVTKTGATRAFLYNVFTSPDGLKSSIAALKEAGVEFIVFLSGSGIPDDMNGIPPDNFLAKSHARVEVNLQDIYGPGGYVAVRPGYFASNSLRWSKMIREGEVKTAYPSAVMDWISPGDIARVAGTVLISGPRDQTVIRLHGPEIISQGDTVKIFEDVLGKDIKLTVLNDADGIKHFMDSFNMPEMQAKALLGMLRQRAEIGPSHGGYVGPSHDNAVSNVQKYGGHPSTTFRQWVEANRKSFEN